MSRVRVVLITNVGPLDYRVPHGMAAPPGSIVAAPLGPRTVTGVVWDDGMLDGGADIGDNRLRNLAEVHPLPLLKPSLRRLVDWVADYYVASHAAVLRMVLAGAGIGEPGASTVEYRSTGRRPARMTPARSRALAAMAGVQASVRELAARAGVSDGIIRGLVKAGAIERVEVQLDTPFPVPDPTFHIPALTDAQGDAADVIRAAVGARSFRPMLLDGVTGSGKTEVYFEGVAETLCQRRQVLVLLPEIALTQPFLQRFADRFGCAPVAWHSGLKASERRRAWRAIVAGDARVVVGARSALFLPYADLALIVVDEAHETSFKQEDGVRYHARDVAVMRGRFEDIPVVLASATPGIESMQMVAAGRYAGLSIPARFGAATLPAIHAVDLTRDAPPPGHWLAPPLVDAINDRLTRGEQCLLFLNRRGYAPLTLCRTCGHRIQCPHCSAWMVEHRLVRRLACHHCGHVMPPPAACPSCADSDSLVACGPGVERIAEEVARLFPAARAIVATSDTLWSPDRAADFVARVEGKAVDIIIGTQLVTKGYHFPDLTLVGVVDADLGLDGGDLRAAERCFQQIAQAAGRAGRGAKPGTVMIQTRNPDAPVIAALVSGDRDAFYRAETAARRLAGTPPFGRFAAIVVSSEDEQEARVAARTIGAAAPDAPGMVVLGPAPAPLSQLRGRYRHRLLIHARRHVELQAIIRGWLGPLDLPRGVRVAIDIDPYSFL